MGIPFLNNIIINSAGHVQFKTTAGADAGKIDQVNNDLVITNAVGDVLLGDGSSDVYIGDGVNNVDILFDQSGSIKADSSTSGVTLTLGSSNTGLVLTSGADIDVTANLDVAGTVDLSNLTIDTAQGTDGQVLTSTGSGIAWEDIASETAERIEVTVKNISGGSLSKGTVVHASPSATPPSGNVIEVIAADYDDSTKMPAIGILNETIANEGEGAAVMMGAVSGIDTSSFNIGDELYVGNLGTLTNTKPVTAGQLIQKIAVVIKSHASNGLIKIFGAGRSNDVPLPLYIDNANQRVGIGEASPAHKLDVNGGAQFNTNTGTTPFYITRLGGTSQALSIKVLDDNVRFESIQDESTDNFGGFDFRMDGGVTEPDFVVRKNSGDPILNVKGDGNVGIGTTSPDTKLHISSTNAAITNPLSVSNKLRFTDDDPTQNNGQITGTIEWETKDSDSAGVQSYITTVSTNTGLGNLAFGTGAGGSASEQMRIDSSGNIGIGTTSPGYKLDVSGTIRSLGSDNAPGTGAGVELRYTGDGAGSVLAYDRGATSYLPIRIEGSTIDLRKQVLLWYL